MVVFAGLAVGQRRPVGLSPDCPKPCATDQCKAPENCEAGVVMDACNCCEVCAKKEFERCDHPDAPVPGELPCGENLECRLRNDLKVDDGRQAACYCTVEGALCGSDGVTYDNLCQLSSMAAKTGKKITVQNKGPCKAAPMIVSPPDNVKEHVGKSVALICEATGYPIPAIEWTWTRVDGKTVFLPSDDLKVSVNMRGGPEKWQVTGWLQVMDMEEKHEGDYTCIAQNELGMDRAQGRIIVDGGVNELPRYRKYNDEY